MVSASPNYKQYFENDIFIDDTCYELLYKINKYIFYMQFHIWYILLILMKKKCRKKYDVLERLKSIIIWFLINHILEYIIELSGSNICIISRFTYLMYNKFIISDKLNYYSYR